MLLAASQLGVAEITGSGDDTLAVNGGKKAVGSRMPKPVRWGEPELEQLGAATKQDSLDCPCRLHPRRAHQAAEQIYSSSCTVR